MHLVEDLIMLLFHSCTHLIHSFRCPNCLRQSNSLFCFLVLFIKFLSQIKGDLKLQSRLDLVPGISYLLLLTVDHWRSPTGPFSYLALQSFHSSSFNASNYLLNTIQFMSIVFIFKKYFSLLSLNWNSHQFQGKTVSILIITFQIIFLIFLPNF